MKIACCLFKYAPYGGLTRDFLKFAKIANHLGHEVYAYVNQWDGPEFPEIKVREIRSRGITNHRRALSYCQEVKKILVKDGIDVSVGFNKIPGVNFYYVADCCYVEKVNREKRSIGKLLYVNTSRYRIFSQLERELFEGSTKIMFIDRSQIEEYEKHYHLHKDRYFIIPPDIKTIETGFNELDDCNKLREELGIKSDSFVIVQVGSDFERKGLKRSLKGVASLPDEVREKIVFFVIGSGNIKKYKKIAEGLGIRDVVKFTGGIDNSYPYIKCSNLLLHPAHTENTGTVIMEALVAGVPSIVTEACGFSHYVEEAGAGFVLRGDFNQVELNNRILEIMSSRILSKRFSSNAKKYIDKVESKSLAEEMIKCMFG